MVPAGRIPSPYPNPQPSCHHPAALTGGMPYSEPARTTPRRIPGILVAGLLVVIASISAGCSKAPAETGAGSSGGNKNAATHEQAVKFARCMRDNGVREFPDPDASGQLTIDGILNGATIEPDRAAV